MNFLTYHPSNIQGRDFVVGDLHGCFGAFKKLLDHVRFHPGLDRVFAVGDLVDRGPQSVECLQLLQQPWFFSCMGNHEHMLWSHLQRPDQFEPHDPVWLKKECPSITDRQRFAGRWLGWLERLPLIMKVGNTERSFYVVHAEILESKRSVTEEMIASEDFVDPVKARHRMLWGRSLITAYTQDRPVLRAHDPNMPKIFCGHTVLDRPLQLAKQVYLDGGAFMAYRDRPQEDAFLRLFDTSTQTCWSCDVHRFEIHKTPVYVPPVS